MPRIHLLTFDRIRLWLNAWICGGALLGVSPVQAVDIGFLDVNPDGYAAPYIKAIKDAGITTGCGNGNYCPGSNVDRQQMAAFIVRAVEGEPGPCTSAPFGDVPVGHPFCKYIQRLKALNITTGCGGGNFCPAQPVTRDQMAAFLVRALEGDPAGAYCGATSPFTDVPLASTFCGHIKRLLELAVTTGCGGGNYCPTQVVNREQMAVFLGRAFLGMTAAPLRSLTVQSAGASGVAIVGDRPAYGGTTDYVRSVINSVTVLVDAPASVSGGSGVLGFQGWSNCDIQVGTRCTITMTSDRTVTATYSAEPHGTYYLGPTGNDSAAGDSPAAPWRTFAHAFGAMQPGDELVLLDGHYTAATTGTIHWNNGSYSAQVPSGVPGRPTYVHALHPGQATIDGALFIGRSTRKDSHIKIQGLTFAGGGQLYNSSFVTLKDCGFDGPFGIGTNDHDNGNTDNLVEDAWVWASGERVIAINYRAHRNVWRRVVVRGDGCGTASCAGSGNPNVGFTVYDSHDVSVQNVMVADRILAPTDSGYADFAIASHTGGLYMFGRNEWLGTLSLYAPDLGYYMEPDVETTLDDTITVTNAVAWGSAWGGFNFARDSINSRIRNILSHSTGSSDGVRVAPELSGKISLTNAVVLGTGRYGINSSVVTSHANVHGTWSQGAYNQTTPNPVLTSNPLANGALRHITRIEGGSSLSGAGEAGSDLGPTILYRYGVDGSRFGEPGYRELTAVPLWPWPNEARIKQEMCANTTRGFCSPGKRLDGVNAVSLTSHVWEAAGNAMPVLPAAAIVRRVYR